MLSSRTLIAGKCAREDVRKQGCDNSRCSLVGEGQMCTAAPAQKSLVGERSKPGKHRLGFMVYSQEGTEFIGICSTSYTSTKTQNPDSWFFFVVCSVECSWFLVVMPERKHAKTQGFVVCECGEVFQYIKKAMRFTLYLQQTSKFAGICSTSYTSRTTEIIGSCGFGRFWGLESETGTNPRATCTAAPAQKRV